MLLSAVDYLIDKRVIFGFEVGSSFVAVQQQVARVLPVLDIPTHLVRELRLQEQEERLVVAHTLGIVQTDLPALPTLVQSGQAIRSLFNTQATSLRGLTERGLLDYASRDKILSYIRRKRKKVNPLLKDLVPRSPIDILLNIPWLEGDRHNAVLITEQVQSASFQHDEVIQALLSPANGMFVILSGVVRVTYEPREEVLKTLIENGTLPTMDFFGALNFEDRLEDFLVVGKVVGEMSALTNRHHDITAVADTAVQAFWLPQTLINSMLRNARTRQLMWLAVGGRIAEELLEQRQVDEKCGSRLGKARVEFLSEEQPSLTLDFAEEVVIVEGVVLDANGEDRFVAPALVPRTVRQVELAGFNTEAVLLAVPLRCSDIETLQGEHEIRRVTVEENSRSDSQD